jgi:phytoene desaturase
MADYDVIVIGGGVAGLAVGGLLAKDGRKTLVLEQNERIGGFCSTFEHDGYRFDVGTSIIEMEHVIDQFFKRMGTSLAKEVDLIPIDPVYTYILSDGTELRYPAASKAVAEEFKKLSPEDARNWLTYAEDMKEFFSGVIPAYFYSPMLTFGDMLGMFTKYPQLLKYRSLFSSSYQMVMDKYFKHPSIREALCFQGTFMGMPPTLVPGVFSILPWNEHNDFYYSKGGLIAIPEAILRVSKKAGMEFRNKTLVEKIIVKNKRACGVILADKTAITADVVVSDISARTLYTDLIGLEHLGPLARRGVKSLKNSPSALMFFLGLDAAPPLKSHHTILTATPEEFDLFYDQMNVEKRLPDRQAGLISWKTHSDPGMAPKGHHTVVMTLFGPYHLAGTDWDTIKKPLTEQYVDYFTRTYLPGMKDHVQVAMLGTPRDFERDLLAPEGGIYQLAQDMGHSGVFRPSTKSKSIEGLYLVGASTHPGGGVPTVICSALIGAELIKKYEQNK